MEPGIRVRRLDAFHEREIVELAEVLIDCVAGGASASFMLPLPREKARAYWRGVAESAGRGERAVLDAGFVRRKTLAMALERRFPERFIPRYSMVMFHPEIPYAEAERRGALQERLLHELDQAGGGDAAADSALAARLVSERLASLGEGVPAAPRGGN